MQKVKITNVLMKELGFIQEPNCWKLYDKKGQLVNLIYNNQLENKTLGDIVKIMTGTAHNIGFKKGLDTGKNTPQSFNVKVNVPSDQTAYTYNISGFPETTLHSDLTV